MLSRPLAPGPLLRYVGGVAMTTPATTNSSAAPIPNPDALQYHHCLKEEKATLRVVDSPLITVECRPLVLARYVE